MSIGLVLAAGAALALLGIGASAMLNPAAATSQYGLPTRDGAALGYLRAVAARDVVLGFVLIGLLLQHANQAVALVLAITALAGAADFGIVARGRTGPARQSLLIHGAGTVGLIVAAILVRAGF